MAKTNFYCLVWDLNLVILMLSPGVEMNVGQSQSAYFLPEFGMSPQESFLEDITEDHSVAYQYDDQATHVPRSDEDRNTGWDAWGGWSECSRTCGGGASYSLRRCLIGGSCDGKNIRYQTCSNKDCPLEAGDFRAQQCSAHNDVKYQGHTFEWIPVNDDSVAPCALKCQAKGKNLSVELAPKVLDGTRCKRDSLDMCINGICQEVGCDRQLGSSAREDNCGVCAGDSSTCRLVKGQLLLQTSVEEPLQTVVDVPVGSRNVRITAKGPGRLVLESHSLLGHVEEHSLNFHGSYIVQNTFLDVQGGEDWQTIRAPGPLTVDVIVKVESASPTETLVQYLYYQAIRYQWRETDFFPCSVTCGGGYQLTSAECTDIRLNRTLPEYNCHSYPENKKPKPKLRECSMEPCPESDGYKEVMPYDHFQPLPRWDHNPWTACSVSCGGGSQHRSVVCVEEDTQGQMSQVEEWKCTYSTRPAMQQSCNEFHCPQWVAMNWSQCTVTCGRGLRYRVVLCIDHRGQHTGGCNAGLKPHIKEDCLVPVACHKPEETLPVEAKLPWLRQAQELEEPRTASEEPTFILGPWQPCSTTCGTGQQSRWVKCRVLLIFTGTEVDLPDGECGEEKPTLERTCNPGPCSGTTDLDFSANPHADQGLTYHWQYMGFSSCSSTCGSGVQEAKVMCLDKDQGETVQDSYCASSSRLPGMARPCRTDPCPPRWSVSPWSRCSATCGVGIQTRRTQCVQLVSPARQITLAVADGECREPKPHALQACTLMDCSPAWHIEDWQECSHTCGQGTQARKVYCQQLLTTGSLYRLADEACRGIKPVPHRACSRVDCPPYMAGGDWSKCSVSCGEGLQMREAICRRRTRTGHQVTLPKAACRDMQPPPIIRSCRMKTCITVQHPKPNNQKLPQNHGPEILGLHRIYIQTRQEKRIHFTIGGRAYLLPRTSVVVRCPVRRFKKNHIKWEKDGEPLQRSRRLGITNSGSLKIHNLEDVDIGIYSCIADTARETFILKLIGNDNKLLEHPEGRTPKEDHNRRMTKLERNEASYLEEKWNRMSKTWQSWSQKNNFYLDDSQAQDRAFLQVLSNYLTSSSQLSHAKQLPDEQLETAILQGAHSLEPKQFEELVRNISELGENSSTFDSLAWHQLIDKLIVKPQSSIEHWTGVLKDTSVKEKLVAKEPNSSEIHWHEKPIIFRQKQNQPAYIQKHVNVSIGGSVFLTNATQNVFLLCAARGWPKAKISWSKDGATLLSTRRVLWDNAGGLHISNPILSDAGVYRCTATNDLGSDTETSQLLWAGAPTISVSVRDVWQLENSTVRAVVGGTVNVYIGANVTLDCPVTGVPQPSINWRKDGGMLGNEVLLLSGSLFLHNVSIENNGTYSCLASNPLGRSVASTLLLISGGIAGRHSVQKSRRRVLMASRLGTAVTARRGDLLHIGCPVLPDRGVGIKWDVQGQPLQETPVQPHRKLVGGRVLEVNTLFMKSSSSYKCQTHTSSKPVSAWILINLEDYLWKLSDWSACTATCGHKGTRSRRVSCVSSSGEEEAPLLCHHHPRPVSTPEPCTVRDCPPSWLSTAWSACSTSCGHATRRRQVFCHQMDSSGTEVVFHPSVCGNVSRPEDVEACETHSCPEWEASAWGQCSGRCRGPALAVQSRTVLCRHQNGSTLAQSYCDPNRRPVSVRNCSTDVCKVQWKVRPWRPCSAVCGSGFQSRRVECVHRGDNRTLADHHCMWRLRPVSWKHCNIASCGSECEDTTLYCTAVKQLKLCHIELYQQRCCQSCREESLVQDEGSISISGPTVTTKQAGHDRKKH